jgi:hypothetical protein
MADIRQEYRRELEDLVCQLSGDVDHGECFYEKDMLDEFLSNLETVRNLALKLYVQNREEMDGEW